MSNMIITHSHKFLNNTISNDTEATFENEIKHKSFLINQRRVLCVQINDTIQLIRFLSFTLRTLESLTKNNKKNFSFENQIRPLLYMFRIIKMKTKFMKINEIN